MAVLQVPPVLTAASFDDRDPVAEAIANAAGSYFTGAAAAETVRAQALKREETQRGLLEDYARPVDERIGITRQQGTVPGGGTAPSDTRDFTEIPGMTDLEAETAIKAGGPTPDGSGAKALETPSELTIDLAPADEQTPDVLTLDRQTRQNIMAGITSNRRGMRDALSGQAKLNAQELAEVERGMFHQSVVEKLANVPGGRLTGLPGLKTREAAAARIASKEGIEQAKIGARREDLGRRLAAKSGENEAKFLLKAYELGLRTVDTAARSAFVDSLINPKSKTSTEEALKGLTEKSAVLYKGIAKSARLGIDSPAMMDIITDDLTSMVDKVRAERGDAEANALGAKLLGVLPDFLARARAAKTTQADGRDTQQQAAIDLAKRMVKEKKRTPESALKSLTDKGIKVTLEELR